MEYGMIWFDCYNLRYEKVISFSKFFFFKKLIKHYTFLININIHLKSMRSIWDDESAKTPVCKNRCWQYVALWSVCFVKWYGGLMMIAICGQHTRTIISLLIISYQRCYCCCQTALVVSCRQTPFLQKFVCVFVCV